jgi:hypothetical protein
MSTFAPDFYGSRVDELLKDRPLLPLAKPPRNQPMVERLSALSPADLFPERKIARQDMVRACLAGLWLAHGCLDESHRISQEIETPTGSYWHGIMHRLEPDFENSKYWFRRVGRHPIFETLQGEAAPLGDSPETSFLRTQTAWDPFAFVDLCRVCVERASLAEGICRAIQRREWELLFDYCYREALGS